MPFEGNIHRDWARMKKAPGQHRSPRAPPTVRPSSLAFSCKGRYDSITERALDALNVDSSSSSDDGGTVASTGVSSVGRGKTPVKNCASLQKSPLGSIRQEATGTSPKSTASVPVAGGSTTSKQNTWSSLCSAVQKSSCDVEKRVDNGASHASVQGKANKPKHILFSPLRATATDDHGSEPKSSNEITKQATASSPQRAYTNNSHSATLQKPSDESPKTGSGSALSAMKAPAPLPNSTNVLSPQRVGMNNGHPLSSLQKPPSDVMRSEGSGGSTGTSFPSTKATITLMSPQRAAANNGLESFQSINSHGVRTDVSGSAVKASVPSTNATNEFRSVEKTAANNGFISLQRPSNAGVGREGNGNAMDTYDPLTDTAVKNGPPSLLRTNNGHLESAQSTEATAAVNKGNASLQSTCTDGMLTAGSDSINKASVQSTNSTDVPSSPPRIMNNGLVSLQLSSNGGIRKDSSANSTQLSVESMNSKEVKLSSPQRGAMSTKIGVGMEGSSVTKKSSASEVLPANASLEIQLNGGMGADSNSIAQEKPAPEEAANASDSRLESPEKSQSIDERIAGRTQCENTSDTSSISEEPNGAQNVVDLTMDSTDEEDVLVVPAPITLAPETPRVEDKTKDCNVKALRLIDSNKPASAQEKKQDKPSPPSRPAKFVDEEVPFLQGKLTVSNDGKSRQLVLRGIWGYKNTPSYTPQRFELMSDLSPDEADPIVLPPFRQFHGSFVYKSTSEKNVSAVIEEKDVNLTFNTTEGNPGMFGVKGSGANQFGRFELNGSALQSPLTRNAHESTATQLNKCGLSYTLKLTKTYVELFPAAALPSTSKSTSGNSSSRKRKVSDTDSPLSNESSTSKRRYKSRPSHDRDAPRSAKSPSPSTDVRIGTPDSPAFNHESPCDGLSTQHSRRKDTLFDQVERADSISSSRSTPEPSEQKMASTQAVKKPKIEHYAMSGVTIKPQYTWTLKDVRPPFSKSTRDFLESEGIHFVNDMLKADTVNLYVKLMASPGFKVACALAAWRSRQSFRKIYKLSLAKLSIQKWIFVTQAWWRKITLSDWTDKAGLLTNFLSPQEALILETKLGIITANQLLMSNKDDIIKGLREVIDFGHTGRPFREIDCICEGMVYSFMMRVREKSSDSVLYSGGYLPTIRKSWDEERSARVIQTPMSCLDFLFIKSQNITSDEEIYRIDMCNMIPIYCSFLEKKNLKSGFAEARNIVSKWKIDASKCLVKECDSESDKDEKELSHSTRIDRSHKNLGVMYNIGHLCRTSMVNGLPTKTIHCFDDANDALYQFRVNVEQSGVSPNSGNGAFLTYQGCKILKESSYWKKKKPSDIPTQRQTRKPLTAVFPGSKASATVTLKGKNIHGDESFYGPDGGIGLFNEYILNDFVDVDNITFSSKHAGCALIELDRYAPLLPVDRKTDLVFGMKDFIFSHEPSSWRFDVSEELNGHQQVVDFTDDTTGSPHSVARSHMSMYVNEVGHNPALVENVCSLETPRSVSYYICIDKPMKKGDKVELLVNYGEHYEGMRERRGYGKSNSHGVESDDHDFSRARRNLKDRMQIEDSILSCSEEDIYSALDFFTTRVWDGLVASTSRSTPGNSEICTYRRQSIARRRLHWVAQQFRARLLQLREEYGQANREENSGSSSFDVVYVNGWMPPEDPRPPYTGIASILSTSRDKFDRLTFNLSIPGSHKTIDNVPEGVVTVPVEDDFANLSSTVIRTWNKKKQVQNSIQLRQQMLTMLDTSFQWDSSFIQQSCPETREKLLVDYRWEFSEELLHLLKKHKRLLAPFDETKWCPMSQSLLQNVLHAVADHTLLDEGSFHQGLNFLCSTILSLASASAKLLKETTTSELHSPTQSIFDWSFLEDSTQNGCARFLVAKAIQSNKMSVDEYQNNPQPLDLEWYLCNQIVMAIHPLASLIHWQDSGYSFQVLCDQVGLDLDSPYLVAHQNESWKPLLCI